MLGRPQLSELYEARIADLKEAHDKQVVELNKAITILIEQIDYLRMTTHKPFVGDPNAKDPEHRARMSTTEYMTEEEEDARHMHSEGLIDAQELEAALTELGVNPAS